MKRVIKTYDQLVQIFREIRPFVEIEPLMVEYGSWKPPRTLSQSRKVHAMINDLGSFCGEKNMKGFIKSLEFWPTEIVEQLGLQKVCPKSEAKLEREEEAIVIEHLYMIGAELPGFEWNHKEEAAA